MIKQWVPIINDINEEIIRLKAAVSDLTFNSDFCHRIHIIKLRAAELNERLSATVYEIKSEAAAEREMIDTMMAEFRREVSNTGKALAELRLLRAERARANYLHIQELKQTATEELEEGGEQ